MTTEEDISRLYAQCVQNIQALSNGMTVPKTRQKNDPESELLERVKEAMREVPGFREGLAKYLEIIGV